VGTRSELAALAVRGAAREASHVTPAQLADVVARVVALESAGGGGGSGSVLDIGDGALPAPAAGEKGKIILDPRHAVGYYIAQDEVAVTNPSASTWTEFMSDSYLGEFVSDTAARGSVLGNPNDIGKFYWNRHNHNFRVWDRISVGGGQAYYFRDIGSDVAAFLAGKPQNMPKPNSGSIFRISDHFRYAYWMGRGTHAELLARLPDDLPATGVQSSPEHGIFTNEWRAYGIVEGESENGLRFVDDDHYSEGVGEQDVFSWQQWAVPGVTSVLPSTLEAVKTGIEDRLTALENAAGGSGLSGQFRVVSRYHSASTHPNDIRGYVADDSDPPLTYTAAGDGRARPSDAFNGYPPFRKFRYVAVQDEGQASPHRLVLPDDANVVHIQVDDYYVSALIFISDLRTSQYGHDGASFFQIIPLLRGTSLTNDLWGFVVAMTTDRELLVCTKTDGQGATQINPAGAYATASARRVTVRVST